MRLSDVGEGSVGLGAQNSGAYAANKSLRGLEGSASLEEAAILVWAVGNLKKAERSTIASNLRLPLPKNRISMRVRKSVSQLRVGTFGSSSHLVCLEIHLSVIDLICRNPCVGALAGNLPFPLCDSNSVSCVTCHSSLPCLPLFALICRPEQEWS